MTLGEGYRKTAFYCSIEQESVVLLPVGCWKLLVHYASYSIIE